MHAKGSFIYLQLWALGRAAHPSQLVSEDPSLPYVSASDVPLGGRTDGILPRPLSVPEIKEYIELYATAASNAVHRAGFDGVEVHGANGYLVDQFLQDVTNVRTDEYGGSPENRTRFAVEIVDAVVRRVGESKTGIRLSPFGSVNSEILIFLLNSILVSHLLHSLPRYGHEGSQADVQSPNHTTQSSASWTVVYPCCRASRLFGWSNLPPYQGLKRLHSAHLGGRCQRHRQPR